MLYKNISDESLKLSAIDVLRSGGPVWTKTEEQRADMTLQLRDTDYLPRVEGAGKITTVDGQRVQMMFNGLLVSRGGYQGEWQARVIEGLKGNHEPQEEKVFYEVLRRIEKPGHMIELGAWWAYYSMWYHKATGGVSIACEPDPNNVELGKKNAKLNNIEIGKDIIFHNVAAGREDGEIKGFYTESDETIDVPVLTVDSIVKKNKIMQLDILHMDIQGYEVDALHSALQTIRSGKLRFLFVSTHHYEISNVPSMHNECIEFIKKHGGHIIASHTVYESCSGDGLVVASFDEADANFTVDITLEHTDNSLFRSPEVDIQILWDAHNRLLPLIYDTESKLYTAQDEIEAANQQIAHLEGKLLEIGNIKNHARKAIVDRLKGIDYRVQQKLSRKSIEQFAPSLSLDEGASVDELLKSARENDTIRDKRTRTPERPTYLHRGYLMLSRGSFRVARKAWRRLK